MLSFKSTLLTIFAAAPIVLASPLPQEPKNSTDVSIMSAPRDIKGPWYNFPAMDTWKTFDQLWDINAPFMNQAGSTWDDIGKINVGIHSAAQEIGVDERVILSIIMQESHGYVGVRTTVSPGGIPTAGIMQCSGCDGYPGKTSLSQAQISSMINGGTRHYKGNLQNWGDLWSPESIYPALREYNSGSVNPDDLSDGRGATASYVSDVSQRLQGWAD